jgi:hypothetical protein
MDARALQIFGQPSLPTPSRLPWIDKFRIFARQQRASPMAYRETGKE